MMPTASGTYVTTPQWASAAEITGLSSPGTLTDAWATQIVDGTGKLFCGTTTKLWGLTSGGAATDLSDAGNYTATNGWSFCQYGNITIACTKTDATQARDSSGASAFADLTGSPPKASICCVQTDAVVLFDYNGGTDTPDGWWASDVGDYTTWTPASSNVAANGRLRETPGKITAAVPFGDDIIVFKERGIYRMTYVGRPEIWLTPLIRGDLGASSRYNVVMCGDHIAFWGTSGGWLFDGSNFTPISDGVKNTLGTGSTGSSCYVPHCRTIIWQGLASYNMISQAWGTYPNVLKVGTGNPSTFKLIAGGFNAINAVFNAADRNKPAATGLSLFGVSFADADIYVGTEWANSTASQSATIATGAFGIGGDIDTRFGRIMPRWRNTLSRSSNAASTEMFATVTLYDNPELGSGTAQSAVQSSSAQKRFDQMTTAKYAKVSFSNVSGLAFASKSFELDDVDWAMNKAGTT